MLGAFVLDGQQSEDGMRFWRRLENAHNDGYIDACLDVIAGDLTPELIERVQAKTGLSEYCVVQAIWEQRETR